MVEVIPAGWRVVTFLSQDAPENSKAIGRILMPGMGKQSGKLVYHPLVHHAADEATVHAQVTTWLAAELEKAKAKAGRSKKPKKGAIVDNIAGALDEVEAVALAAAPEPEDEDEDDDGEYI